MPMRPTSGGAPPADVVPAHPHHDDDHQADDEHQRQGEIDGGGDFVFGAQALVIAGPLLGDFEVLAVAADLVAEEGDFDAIGGVVQLEIALLPGEGAVDAMGAGDVGGFDEVERGGVAGEAGAQEILGQGACLRRGWRRGGRRLPGSSCWKPASSPRGVISTLYSSFCSGRNQR